MGLQKKLKNNISTSKQQKSPPNWERFTLWVLLAAAIGLLVAVGIFVLLYYFVFPRANTPDAAWGLPDVITATATAIGGLTVGGVALIQVRKHQFLEYQAKNEREVQLNERDIQLGEQLRRAIEHLGDKDREHIRLGAIYEFKRLEKAKDLQDYDRDSIVRILASFIESRMAEEKKAAERGEVKEVAPDIKAAAELASQIIKEEIERTAEKCTEEDKKRPPEYVFIAADVISTLPVEIFGTFFYWNRLSARNVDLRGIELKRAHLNEAHLEGAVFKYANLDMAILRKAQLDGADLYQAQLERASLRGAHLEGAVLGHAHLKRAQLEEAHLEGADLFSAHLEWAVLRGAHLKWASLVIAHLEGAHLEGALLEGAHLEDAHLEDAWLRGAHLEEAHLEGADLRHACLVGADLRDADFNDRTVITAETTYNSSTIFSPGIEEKYFRGKATKLAN
ncbi:MAG: pentapeptide repeat-containing protein [Oscillospiraceae bacterium]|nr:pentapeptide repeat-containing protein [Oscillospiraceae bacterium]